MQQDLMISMHDEMYGLELLSDDQFDEILLIVNTSMISDKMPTRFGPQELQINKEL